MANGPFLPQDEQVFQTGPSASGSKVLPHPEQKNMVWMKKIISKCTLLGGYVVDCCAGTFLDAKANMLLPENRRSVWCYLASKYFASSLPHLALTVTRQTMREESDISDDDIL